MIRKIFCGIAILALLSACVDSKDDDITRELQYGYDDCFAAVKSEATGEITISRKPRFNTKISYNRDTPKEGEVTISNLVIPGVKDYTYELPTMLVKLNPDLSMSMSAPYADAANLKPAVRFNDFRFSLLPRYMDLGLGMRSMPVYYISFEYENRYLVTVYPILDYVMGKTVSVNTETQSAYENTKIRYGITFNLDKMTATVELTGAQFLENMPALNMEFPNVPFTITDKGIELAADNIIPTIRGVEYPSFPIRNLHITYLPLHTTTLEFDCQAMTFGLFHVTAQLNALGTVKD